MNSKLAIHNKFQHIFKVVNNESFLNKETLHGEISFWISSFDIANQALVKEEITNLQKKLQNEGCSTLVIDLFQLTCDIIEEHFGMEKMLNVEKKKRRKESFLKSLQSTINIQERLIPEIVRRVEKSNAKLLFLDGIAAVYPFIRSHSILNNLHAHVDNIPVVMFYPGKYTGQTLQLFEVLEDDNYYRAFNIDKFQF